MQKLVMCDVGKFEEKVNSLMSDGWRVIPDTIRMSPGMVMTDKEASDGNAKTREKDRKAIGYAMAVLEKT